MHLLLHACCYSCCMQLLLHATCNMHRITRQVTVYWAIGNNIDEEHATSIAGGRGFGWGANFFQSSLTSVTSIPMDLCRQVSCG